MRSAFILGVVLGSTFQPGVGYAQTEGDYLYNVVTLQAAPGHYNEMVEAMRETFELTRDAGDHAPFWARHSQGDKWDFMLIFPMESFQIYFSGERAAQRERVWGSEAGVSLARRLQELTAHREDWFSRSVDLAEMERRFEGMNFYHIEMFAGLPGKREELYEQRRMENRYYEHLDRQQNLLFIRVGGAPWDAMTIGFYENLQAFAAAGAGSSAADQDEAAKAADFDSVDDIGPYLRSLLSYHNDTLGVRVQ